MIVAFGCPRSGTTFLYHALSALPTPVVKLSEHTAMHPCRSRTGLLDIADLFHGHALTFVRIKRHPMETAESFLAARLPEAGDAALGLARNTDRDVVRWIRSESDSVACQRDLLAERDADLIEVRYEDLGAKGGREAFVDRLKGGQAFQDRLQEFGTKPTRFGRLSMGVGSVATEDEAEYFRRRLKVVMKREGYA